MRMLLHVTEAEVDEARAHATKKQVEADVSEKVYEEYAKAYWESRFYEKHGYRLRNCVGTLKYIGGNIEIKISEVVCKSWYDHEPGFYYKKKKVSESSWPKNHYFENARYLVEHFVVKKKSVKKKA